MAMMTPEDVRRKLALMIPSDWCVLLELAEHRLDVYGFPTLKEFLETPYEKGGVGIKLPDAINLIHANVNTNPRYRWKGEELEKKLGVSELAKSVPSVIERGEGNKEGINQHKRRILDKTENVKYPPKPSEQGGNSKVYRIAKLKRDYPDIAQRLMDGEFKSISEAERAAGVRPPKANTYRLVLPIDDEPKARIMVDEFFKKYY